MPVIDDFEDGDIVEYNDPDGQKGQFDVVTTNPYEGTYCLHGGRTPNYRMYSTTGLSNYPSAGDTIRWRHEINDGDDTREGVFWFGVQSETEPDFSAQGYYVSIDSANGNIVLGEESTGVQAKGANTNWPLSEWYEMLVYWDIDGTGDITAVAKDASGTELDRCTLNDTTWRSGGVGWGGGGASGTEPRFDYAEIYLEPPSNLTAAQGANDGEVNLSWTNNSSYDSIEVYRAQSSGSTLSDYSLIDTLTTAPESYTDTSAADGEKYYYRVRGESGGAYTDLSNEGSAVASAPQPGVSLTVQANDQIDISITDTWSGNSPSNYRVHIERDGDGWYNPSGGPTTPGSAGTHSYGPNSDSSYVSQVGIDSRFRFRVRAEGDHYTTGYTYSGSFYTDPVPPHAPSVSRPDADTFNISATRKTDIPDYIQLYARKDIGGGYGGAWDFIQNFTPEGGVYGTSDATMPSTAGSKGGSYTLQLSVGDTTQGQSSSYFQEDARYQFRLRHRRRGNPSGNRMSDWVYADYGNNGNVYFEDDFESGDLGAWSGGGVYGGASDADSGIQSGSHGDLGISGADQGTYYCRLDSGDDIRKQIGSISSDTYIIVKAVVATGSMDSSGEETHIEWYDGSTYQNLRTFSHEYNKQGWVEVAAVVPSSYLNSNNHVRFRGHGGGGDHFAVDRVVVSDVLHEYTLPSAASALSLDTSVEDEITASWTDNATFEDAYDSDFWERSGDDTTWNRLIDESLSAGATSRTFTGLDDGRRYLFQINPYVRQARRGSVNNYWGGAGQIQDTAIALLPAPTSLSSPSHDASSIDIAWTDNHDYGDTEVQYKRSSSASWTTWATLSRNTESDTITGLLNGELYDIRVLATTTWTQTEDA